MNLRRGSTCPYQTIPKRLTFAKTRSRKPWVSKSICMCHYMIGKNQQQC